MRNRFEMPSTDKSKMLFLKLFFFTVFLNLLIVLPLQAQPYYQGAETCKSCHEAEYEVWGATKHFESFREVYRKPLAKEILAAVGGEANMRTHAACTLCHFTVAQESADAKPRAGSGPSCESCHGASSEWLKVHNDYGGPSVNRATETPEHKLDRVGKASANGMIWPDRHYDLASKCMTCHGLTHPELDGETVGKMLDAGHPLKSEYEFVQYSQGSVRHRFYPPAVAVNAEMTPEELARFFVAGQAAKLVSATEALTKSSHEGYVKAQNQRLAEAQSALRALASVPEAAVLLDAPTEENARKLTEAIKNQNLTPEIGSLLPDPSTYK